MTATDTFIETCVVDGSELWEDIAADETGLHTYFKCSSSGPTHVYPARFDGIKWSPIDQHDYE